MSSDDLSGAAQRVKQALDAAGIGSRVVELPHSTRTSVEAANAIGCAVEQIAKSVVFRRADDGGAVLVLLRGVDRVDTKVLAAHLGATVERATPEFVREATGFVIGGVPPVAHAGPVHTIVDEALLTYERVWAAAGTPNAVFSADPRDLAALGTVIAVAQTSERR